MSIAHRFKDKVRTDDVLISESVDFSGLLLSDHVLQGLIEAGFKKPSPIQLKAIPLGRCGLDLIVQAKSGTGKTCVFTVVALESLELQSVCVQVLILAPTREIAIQIQDVIQTIGKPMKGLKCCTFIGGLPVNVDKTMAKSCHIAVGTPGRVKQLIDIKALKTSSIRLFILDEADKLLEGDFQESINWIYSTLPENKQILALSATYPEILAQHLTAYMRNPTFVRLNVTDPALLGIKQYHVVVPNHPMPNVVFNSKTEAIVKILSSVSFQQCLIFSNFQTRAQNLQSELQSRNWPTACIAGYLDQKERNLAMEQLKTYKCRILISTDLTSRGIDADKVNLVINLDVPTDHETYLHRIGRAGRFGSFGATVTIVTKGGQDAELWAVERKCGTHIHKLPDPIPNDLVTKPVPIRISDVVSTQQIINKPSPEIGSSLGAPADYDSSHFQETHSSSINLISEHSEQPSLSYEEKMVAYAVENVQITNEDKASGDEELVKLPKTGQLDLSDTEHQVVIESSSNSNHGLVSFSPSQTVNVPEKSYSVAETDCILAICTEDHALTILEHAVPTLALGVSKTNSSNEYSETSAKEAKITNFSSLVSHSSDKTSDDDRLLEPRISEEYLDTSSYACVNDGKPKNCDNLTKIIVKSTDVLLGQENKMSPKNIDEPELNHLLCSSESYPDVLGSFHCKSVLQSENCTKDADQHYQTNDTCDCNKSNCSSACRVVNTLHDSRPLLKAVSYIDNISKKIFSVAISVSSLLSTRTESECLSAGDNENVSVSSLLSTRTESECFSAGDDENVSDLVSDNIQSCCDSASKESAAKVACNTQSCDQMTTSQEKAQSSLTIIDEENVNNGENINILHPPLLATTDDLLKEMLQTKNTKLKSYAEKKFPADSKRRSYLRSFALTDFLQYVNEDLSSFKSKKMTCSLNVADENKDVDSITTLTTDLCTTAPDPLPSDLKGSDFTDVSSRLSHSKLQLECGTCHSVSDEKIVNNLQLNDVEVGDCDSSDVATESSMVSNFDLPHDQHDTLVMNSETEMLNRSCSEVSSRCHETNNMQHVEHNKFSDYKNKVYDSASTTVAQSPIKTEPDTLINNSLPSSESKDFSKPQKNLLSYLSSLLVHSHDHNQQYKFTDLEANHRTFCEDSVNEPSVVSHVSVLMDNFMVEDFTNSKDIQDLCAFEAGKLVAVKSVFEDKLLMAKRDKSQIVAKLKSRNDNDVHKLPQINKHSHQMDEKAGDKQLQSSNQAMLKKQHMNQGPKGRGKKKLQGSDSLNWRSQTGEKNHDRREKNLDRRERQMDQGYNSSSRKETLKLQSFKENNVSKMMDQEARNTFSSDNDKEVDARIAGSTTLHRLKPVLNHRERNREYHELDDRGGNMLIKNKDRVTENLHRQDNPSSGHVKTKDVVGHTDKTEHIDDECKMLDDMHTQMLMRRKERKLRQQNVNSKDDKMPASHVSGMETVSGLKVVYDTELNTNTQTINTVEPVVTDNSIDKENLSKLEDDVVMEQLANKQLGNNYSLVLETRSGLHTNVESKHSNPNNQPPHTNEEIKQFTYPDNRPSKSDSYSSSKQSDENKVRQEIGSKSTTIKNEQYKQKTAENDKIVGSGSEFNSQAGLRRPSKPSKTEARMAGLEVSSGSTSSTSDLSLSSASDISDVNSSDLDNRDIILSSQCYANKYAHDGYGDLKDDHTRSKNKLAKKMLIKSANDSECKHQLFQKSTSQHAPDYFQHDCGATEDYSMSNTSVAPSKSTLSAPQDYQPCHEFDQNLQDYSSSVLPSSRKSWSKNTKVGETLKHIKKQSRHAYTINSQTQEHRGKMVEKSTSQIPAELHKIHSSSKSCGHSYKLTKQTDDSTVSESEDEYFTDGSTSDNSPHLHTQNPHQPCTCFPMYGHPCVYPYHVPWFHPYSTMPLPGWQNGYPTHSNYGLMQPLPPYQHLPWMQPPPYQYQTFYHNNHFSEFHYQQQPMFQPLLSQSMWDYVNYMTKALSYLSREHRGERISRKK